MPIVELPDGREVEFPDSMSQDQMAAAIHKNFPEFAPKAQERSWAQAATDTAKQLGEGVNTIAGAIPNLVAPEGRVAKFFNENADFWRGEQSQALKDKIARADKTIGAAGEEGVIAQVLAAAKEYSSDPALAARFVTTNLPSMIPGIAAAKVAQAAALARGASAVKAAGVATTAAGGVNAALNAGGARGEAFEDVKRTLMAKGVPEAQAEQQAIKDSRLPAAVGGVTGFISGKTGLEGALVGKAGAASAVRRGAASMATELAGEQMEEVAPKLTTNYQAGQYDGRALGQDVGRTIVETAIGSGPGAVVGGVSAARNRPAPSEPAPPAPPAPAAPRADVGDVLNANSVDDAIDAAVRATSSPIAGDTPTPADIDALEDLYADNAAGGTAGILGDGAAPDPVLGGSEVPAAPGLDPALGSETAAQLPAVGATDAAGALADDGAGLLPAGGAADGQPALTTRAQVEAIGKEISADEARSMVAGKTEKPGGVDPARQIDAGSGNGSQYRIGSFPLSMFRPNEEGDLYDGTVNRARAEDYAQRGAAGTPPIVAVYSPKTGKINVLDGGHRISAARMRGDQSIDALVSLKREKPAPAPTDESADWHAFPPETGTLSIPRADMPQLPAHARGAMTQFLSARGITHQQVEVDAAELKPTQAEFSLSKVKQAQEYQGGNRSILVSSDGHVLDGHHQWLAAVEAGQPVKAIVLDAPIAQLLETVREFPSAGVDTASAPAAPKQAAGPRKLYHGTRREFDAFDPDRSGGMVSFAETRNDARRYAMGAGGGRDAVTPENSLIFNDDGYAYRIEGGSAVPVGTWQDGEDLSAQSVTPLKEGDTPATMTVEQARRRVDDGFASVVPVRSRIVETSIDGANLLDTTTPEGIAIIASMKPTNRLMQGLVEAAQMDVKQGGGAQFNYNFWSSTKGAASLGKQLKEGIVKALKDAGYDGIRFSDDGHTTVGLFDTGLRKLAGAGEQAPAKRPGQAKLDERARQAQRQEEAVKLAAQNIAARKKTGGQAARDRLQQENPFLHFLAEQGLQIDERSDTGGQDRKNRMVPGFGPVYRRTGKRLDELAALALEAGFLTQQDIDSDTDTGGTRKLAEMIERAVHGNEVVQRAASPEAAAPTADEQLLAEAARLGIDVNGMDADQVYDAVATAHADDFSNNEARAMSERADERDVDLDAGTNSNLESDEELDAIFGPQSRGAGQRTGETQESAAADARGRDQETSPESEGEAGPALNAFGLPMGVSFVGTEKVTVGDLKVGDWITPDGTPARVLKVKDNGDGTTDLLLEMYLSTSTYTFPNSQPVPRKIPGKREAPKPTPTDKGEPLLSSYSAADVVARQEEADARAKAEKLEADRAERQRKREQTAREIQQRIPGTADDFQLGQSAEQALEGQRGLRFSVAAEDTAADIPIAFMRSMNVPTQVWNRTESRFETKDMRADQALEQVRGDIDTYQRMIACMKG